MVAAPKNRENQTRLRSFSSTSSLRPKTLTNPREDMGSQAPLNGDRSRTNWTPAMERYFIDLMLDQVHRGNRMGHTFNKQAWNDMLVMFNANFGSPYDVNALKSRYTNLWKQFNDIKNLLDQNGFSWDNNRQMLIAEKYVWDAYIKAHPDAQFYRNRALINFNDLCLIYAHTTADGRYSLSSHDIDFDDDIQAMNFAVGVNSLATASKEQPKTDWTPAMDRYFVKLMLDQLKKGNKINNAFKKQAWKDMLTMFNTKFGSQYGKNFLKQRYKKLLKYYTDVRDLLLEKGFSWDEKQQMITADSDVWDYYIKAHPDVRCYRKKPLLNYHDLSLIYGNAISNGNFQRGKNFEDDKLLYKNGEEREGHSTAGNGHLAHSEDPDSEGPDLMIGEEIQSLVNGNCSRTDWTPSMDRYLIDLMLEQGHKMSNMDNTMDNQVWIDMVALFKERFGLQHDKDVLRSRCKGLEKQYVEMKDLLDRREFWWDETQQMVTAYDDVWDAYIEGHPDAEPYRTKSGPNYNDLCIIYGNSTAEGGSNPSGQGEKFSNSYHWRTDWTPSMDRCFIDLMLEQIRYGSMVNHKFSKLAWTDMVAKFRAQFGCQHDKDVLKSRFLNLRKRFNDMKTLLDHSGFAWDEMQQMVTADDDLWDAYIKEYPDARSYRNRTLPNFNDLFLIYGNSNSIKRDSYSSNSIEVEDDDVAVNIVVGEEYDQCADDIHPPREHLDVIACRDSFVDTYNDLYTIFSNRAPQERSSYLGVKMEMENNVLMPGMDDSFYDMQSPAREFEIYDQPKKRKSRTSKSACTRKVLRTLEEEMQETTHKKRGLADRRANEEEDEDYCSIEKVVAALETVPDMNDELFLEACQLLEDERKAKMFVAMDVTARKKWLLRKLCR
ncbi:uncharacterized protein LOC107411969 isoform X2 [Ziziphus jujuba]|uniref:Uncharacterized protein LOC107411969 isoform X2 n=1 Tax=Ziziphus jujuba TaxID=326968 RepID=A0ABM3IAG8_ZIZJJ|nr:uncharacterized protein LOC107411969 isoform X2 [Ziziphus jujuba]